MSFNVEITSYFKKQAKRLVKKTPSLKKELMPLVGNWEQDPVQGTSIGNHCYKIRIAIASKNKGNPGRQNNYQCSDRTAKCVYVIDLRQSGTGRCF